MPSDNIDNIDISDLFRSYDDNAKRSLRELFELKLVELNINQTQALKAMEIASRALNSMLNGDSSVDVFSLVKLSRFLEIPQTEAVNLYLNSLKFTNEDTISSLEKRNFILKNFDVNELKKEGVIKNAKDFEEIEKTLCEIFHYDSIFDYRRDVLHPALSAGKLYDKNPMSDYWIEYSRQVFRKINNTHPYDQKSLIEYFPTIRWHSQNVEKGLWEVIRSLYRIGITVIYLPKLKKLHIRGATFSVNKKPCIVLTNYRGFYPTLWFALLHELHHVIFDWEDIKLNSFHLSDKNDAVEATADKFAKDYLFSEDKMRELLPHINNKKYVIEYCRNHHVHESIFYAFVAFERNSWGWYSNQMPKIDDCLKVVKDISYQMPAADVAEFNINNIYR